MDPLGVAASVIALMQATSTIIKYLQDVKDAVNEILRLSHELTGLQLLLRTLDDRLRDAHVEDPWFQGCLALAAPGGSITQLDHVVKELNLKLKPETGLKRLGQKLTWSITKHEFDGMLAQIERLKS